VDEHRHSPAMQAFREALMALGIRPTLTFTQPIDPA
jgi:quinol monooxygenase YgiN